MHAILDVKIKRTTSECGDVIHLLHPELRDAKSDGFRKVTARLHRVFEVISKVTPIKNIQKKCGWY